MKKVFPEKGFVASSVAAVFVFVIAKGEVIQRKSKEIEEYKKMG